jgi:hypothetical protein
MTRTTVGFRIPKVIATNFIIPSETKNEELIRK